MIAAVASPIRWCRLLGAATLALFMVAAFTPAANILDAWLGIPPRIEPAEAIVVLGAGGDTLGDGLPNDTSLRRAIRAVVLYRQGLAPLLVFSGSPAEVEGRVETARELGVPSEAVLRAPGSNTTRDEAVRIGGLLRRMGVRKILLVTEAEHMIRARRLFERAGLDPLPATVGDRGGTELSPEGRLDQVRDICGELLARLYYRVAGYL